MQRLTRSQALSSKLVVDENDILDFNTPKLTGKTQKRAAKTPFQSALSTPLKKTPGLFDNTVKSPPRAFKDKTNKTPFLDNQNTKFHNDSPLGMVKSNLPATTIESIGAKVEPSTKRRPKSVTRKQSSRQKINESAFPGVIRETSKQNTSSNDKEKDYGVKLKEVESKLKDYKLKQQADDVPDIEYCPHHEELPFEPSEDLNVDVDIFRHGPSSDAYEFANITPIEHPMPEIDEVDTKSIDHFIIPEAECYSFNNYQPSELSFEVVFDEIFGPLPPIGQMWTEEISI
ncbi:hypothetical protein G9A89_019103 [Geosiphon pyriformis]|nr:hypothetical protein G9A89_019103 [Geosiphon pyriformis]